jgi:hypothetical protein
LLFQWQATTAHGHDAHMLGIAVLELWAPRDGCPPHSWLPIPYKSI